MFETLSKAYWDKNWVAVPRGNLSSLNVFSRDLKRLLLSPCLDAKSGVAEIGFAPGKTLAWVHDRITGNVIGVDYSETGCALATEFFDKSGRKIRVLCADAESIRGFEGSLDLVYSVGVVEHCADPTSLVLVHLKWISERGLAIMLIPNYSGVYHYIQEKLDPKNLEIHNLDLMRLDYWAALEKRLDGYSLQARFFGHPSPWILSFQRFGIAGRIAQYALNFLFFLLPSGNRFSGSIVIVGRRK